MQIDRLHQELHARAMNAEGAFSFDWAIGKFQLRYEHGQPVSRVQEPELEADTAKIRAWAEQIDGISVMYPQTKTNVVHVPAQENFYTEEYLLSARIVVSEEYVQLHTGRTFRKLLEEQFQAKVSALIDEISNCLKKHELKTRRLFGEALSRELMKFAVTEEDVHSEIWMLPYEKYDLYPLKWDSEICGMALLLKDRLQASFPEESFRIVCNEKTKSCTILMDKDVKYEL